MAHDKLFSFGSYANIPLRLTGCITQTDESAKIIDRLFCKRVGVCIHTTLTFMSVTFIYCCIYIAGTDYLRSYIWFVKLEQFRPQVNDSCRIICSSKWTSWILIKVKNKSFNRIHWYSIQQQTKKKNLFKTKPKSKEKRKLQKQNTSTSKQVKKNGFVEICLFVNIFVCHSGRCPASWF